MPTRQVLEDRLKSLIIYIFLISNYIQIIFELEVNRVDELAISNHQITFVNLVKYALYITLKNQ